MFVRHCIPVVIGLLSLNGLGFAQNAGSTMLHDFDGIGDLSSLRSYLASFELVDGERIDRGRALRISFDPIPNTQNGSPELVFEGSSLPERDFVGIEALSFWVKNESNRGSNISISAQDLDGKRSWTSPDRVYVSAGASRQIVYRLDLQGLDRERVGSLHLSHESQGQAVSFLFDDFELLSPLAAQLASLRDRVRQSLEYARVSAKLIGLEAFTESDTEQLVQRFRDASSLPTAERLPVLSLLARDAERLGQTIHYRSMNLTLRGRQVSDEWLVACAPRIADAVRVSLFNTSITDAGLAHLRSLEHLEVLSLSSPEITGSGLKDFASLNLRSVYCFEGSGINDAGLESIAAFPRIEEIFLQNIDVTDAELRHLDRMKSLKSLTLRGSAITDKGLSYLKNLTDLESLDLASTDVSSLAELGNLKKLKHLILRETQVDDAGLAGLGEYPELETLDLSKTDLLGPGLAGLKGAMQLSVLKLNDTRINDAALVGLIELPKLTRLEVSSTRITDATLVRIARAKPLIYGPHSPGGGSPAESLAYLDIYGTNVTGDGIRRLAELKQLRELYAGGTGADDASITALVGLSDLFHLDLQGTRITDASLEPMGKFKNLNSLNLSGTAVTGLNISKLAGIEELRTLNLASTSVANGNLDTITGILVREVNADNGSGGGFAWLNHLILSDTDISDEGLENISRLKHLFTLRLDGTKLGDQGLERIALLPELHSLWLDRTAVSDEGLARLSNLHQLRTLSLKRTGITDEALSRIGDSIQELSLSHTRVTDAGVGRLAGREGLQVLELAGTAVTDRSLESIAQVPALRVIDLSATPITDRGVAALRTLPALAELRLDRTGITDRAAESLARFESLGKVSLAGSRVSADGKALLGRRRPELAVDLDFPWEDVAWSDGESPDETPWSSSVLPEDATVTDLEKLTAVRSLSLQHRHVDAETLVALRDLGKLESLDLADTSVDDALLAKLSGLPRLRALRLSRTEISDDGLQHLAGLKTLEHLDLDGTRVTGAGLQYLAGLPSMRSIHLRGTLFQNEHAAQLARLKSLRKISLTKTRLSDFGLRELERLPALRYLDLFGTDVSDAGLESIGRMSSLSHLYLSATAVTDLGLAALVGLEELVELGIDHCEISDRGLSHLTGFRHLERLRLDGTQISDLGVRSIAEKGSLRRLELNDTAVSDRSVEALLKLTALEELEMDGSMLSDRGLEKLASLASLKRLSVRDAKVSRSGIEAFKARRPEVEIAFESEPSKFSWPGIILSVLYSLIAAIICFYGAHRYYLVWLFLRHRGVRDAKEPGTKFSELPQVTLQIPLFNERNVAERIIAAACAMDYPRDRLQIQVLDDSTDDCTDIVLECCERFRAEGINVVCLHRESREGFKSGALAAGLETATGELIAVFDADFVPSSNFLQRTVHYFTDEKVGVVQAEWRHLNREASMLTQCQAMFLNGHFVVEQAVRARTGRWFNFNGTAGIWRRSCIEQSGGWRQDTLTEDTDLSYRAQLDGWRFVYLPDVHVDAELPSTMSAFLSQQHRWTRGLLQCALKLMPRILSSKAPLAVKAEAWFHLTTPILYGVMFVLAALAVPATFVAMPLSQLSGFWAWGLGVTILLGGTLAAAVFYVVAERVAGQSFCRTVLRLPALMALGIGMSAVNSRALAGALLGVRSPFVRTPKFGGRSDAEADPVAGRGIRAPVGSVELLISGVLFACLFLGLRNEYMLIGVPFLLLFASGFLWVGCGRFVAVETRETTKAAFQLTGLRWAGAAVLLVGALVVLLGTASIWRTSSPPTLAIRVAGIDLVQAEWAIRGSSVSGVDARFGGLMLDVDLDPVSGGAEEGEVFIDLTGPLAPLGASLSDSQELVFEIAYPRHFSGELQAFVSDSEGRSQYGSIAFVEPHDTQQRVRVGIAPSSLTPAMGYTDADFDPQRSIRRIGLKISAQSDRVRGRGYRPFSGELAVAGVRFVPRTGATQPDDRTVAAGDVHPSMRVSWEEFRVSSGADRPWPLGYAFSGPLSADQRETLDQSYAALEEHGLGFTRVYVGDYRTGLILDAAGRVAGVEPQFLEFLDGLAEIANRRGVTVMFSLMDNTVLDGKGVEFPEFVVDREESDRFIGLVLVPLIEKLAERQVIWDLFNEPENVTGAELSTVQHFVDRALSKLRQADADARFTVVSRSARDLVHWRGRGLDILSHNIFDPRGLVSAVDLRAKIELDAPVWIAEMDPELATKEALEALHSAGYRGVGLWGWGTGDKYDWSAGKLNQIVSPLIRTGEKTEL